MPQLTAALQVALLLSAVPAQYLLSRWTSGTAAQRSLATQGILDTLKWVKESYLNMAVWEDWLNSWFLSKEEEMDFRQALEETFSLELMMQNNDQGYFGVSEEPRSPRPEYVLHRVGEVIMETQNNMVGVIVGWDTGLRAPPQWIKRKKYTDSEVQKLEDTPHYRILFSGPDQSSLLIGYIPQTAIHRFDGLQPDIPTLGNYFYHFDGKRFVMQEWLKERYPED
uniref:Si:dkey-261l7.2 n=1 Tax=Astyanax mexicanus TaxID=7994 RepID=A0A8B9L8E0_ASTMX